MPQPERTPPFLPTSDLPVIVVMGVCGVGKSNIAGGLSAQIGADFIEADDYHSEENKSLMARGVALTDAQREPWLTAVADAAAARRAGGRPVVVACSALKRRYRETLTTRTGGCVFVHLTGAEELIAARLTNRSDHFVGRSLLDSQLATLEPLAEHEPGIDIDIAPRPDRVVAAALDGLAALLPSQNT